MALPDEFFPYVQPSLTSCPNPIVRQAILQTAIDFCKRSLCWTKRLSTVPLIANKSVYTLSLPGESRLVEVLNVFGTGRELDGRSFDVLIVDLPQWATQTGNPIYFVPDTTAASIEVFPKPNTDAAIYGTLTARVALTPTKDAEEVPELLLDLWQDAIAWGSMSRLKLMSNQPWSDPALGQHYEQKYLVECDNARIEHEHGKQRGSYRVQPRPFGRVGR